MAEEGSAAPSQAFAGLLRQYRLAAGLSQTELAARAGISWRAVTDLERGASRTPHRDTLDRLLRALPLEPHERAALEATVVRRRGPRGAPPTPPAPAGPPPDAPDLAGAAGAAPRAPSPLPAQLTPFVGRQRDVAAVLDLLRQPAARLLTLWGPAGIGKTRLGLRVAQALVEAGTPVTFVPLASVDDPDLVVPALADTLALADVPGLSLLDLVVRRLGHGPTVLLLDNLEQVVEARATIAVLLEHCPDLRVLVTSRTLLHLYGENVYTVPPLSLPPRTGSVAPDDVLESEAVQLFVQRAQAVSPAFSLTAESAPAVAAMCAHLEGLPLAIELAAARTRFFSAAALRAQLTSRLDLLVGGPRDRPARQQSLRQAIAWSYDLLEDGEKSLFARLAVFAGGWSVEAATAVCTAAGGVVVDVHEGLLSLVDKSLVQVAPAGTEEARFTMLEMIREYATARLAERGEAARLHRDHTAYFTARAEDLAPQLFGPDQVRALARLEQDYDNIRAALSWTREHNELTLGLRLARAICPFWDTRSRLTEGRRWLEALLAAGDGDESRERQELRAVALRRAGLFASRQGDYARAQRFYEESLGLCRLLGDRTGMAATLNNLGIIALDGADYARAERLFGDSLVLRRELGAGLGIAQVLNNLGEVARAQGDFARARAYYEETLALTQESRQEWGTAIAYLNLGSVASEQGDDMQAAEAYRQGLGRLRVLGDARNAAEGLEGMARLAAARGALARAARLYGAADALRERVGAPHPPHEQAAHTRRVATVGAALGEASFMAAWQGGRALGLHQAVEEALATDA